MCACGCSPTGPGSSRNSNLPYPGHAPSRADSGQRRLGLYFGSRIIGLESDRRRLPPVASAWKIATPLTAAGFAAIALGLLVFEKLEMSAPR